jgi:hypothetical protein
MLDVIDTLSLCVVNYMTALHCVMLMSFDVKIFSYYIFSVMLARNGCVPAAEVVCTDTTCKVKGNKICYVEESLSNTKTTNNTDGWPFVDNGNCKTDE